MKLTRCSNWLAAAGVATESVKSWIFPVRLRPRLVEYVRQQKTDEKLRLRRHDCDNWYIDGHMLRILGTKRPIA